MEILSITLKNFKSHHDRHFIFQPGTNAICGENGAGKTSILEAIAWTLFNYRGAYKSEDLIRNGAASTQVTITFVSNRDQRTYQVSRCSRTGYTIFDPQLNQKLEYSRIDDEVIPWMREHLGVPQGTDLGKLFANTIGVPQGTFTVDFLQTAEKRKPIFDAILKVEEYRQANQQMLSLEKYAKAEVEKLEGAIAQYEEALKDWDTLTLKRYDLSQDIEQTQLALQHAQQQVKALQAERDRLTAQEAQIQQLSTQLIQKTTQFESQTQVLERLKIELQQAEQAVAVCTQHRESYRAFLQVEEALQELEQSRRLQTQLLEQRQSYFTTLSDRQTQLATLTRQSEELTAAKSEISHLEPLIQQQIQLEQQQNSLNKQLQSCQLWRQTIIREEQRLAQLLTKQERLATDILRLGQLATVVQHIPQLEEQQQRYQQQLSRIAAATQFEADLRRIVTQAETQGADHAIAIQTAETTLQDLQQAVPLWTEAVDRVLTTLRQGTSLQGQLMTDLQTILQDLAEQTATEKIQQQLQQVKTQLQTARQQQAQYLTLNAKVEEQQRLEAEITEVQASLDDLRNQLIAEADLKEQFANLTQAIAQLNDPRGQTRLLQQKLQAQPQLEDKLQKLQRSLQDIQTTIAQIDAQLAPLATLSEQFQTQQTLRESYRSAHQLYIEHQQLANSYRQRQSQLATANSQLEEWQQEIEKLTNDRNQLKEQFDPLHFQTIQRDYQTANDQKNLLSGGLPEKVKRLEEIDLQRERLQAIQAKRAEAETQLKQQVKAEKFVKFARKAYKEAGPRITERYVQNISREADRLFRELLNRPNVSLEWTRDYEILVQEGAHVRRFINLSGGEQMCAALAVRLALLKVLADIDIAFFDEPTTNMDKPRREQLAEAIANIKTFRQLFVISHDDTFEKVTENIIWVEREA
jgi:DNA repair protein SbcC/Rad50